MFGRISQKGRIKSGAAGQICGVILGILADFEQKGSTTGRTFKKIVSLRVFFLSPNSSKKLILLGNRIIFHSGRIFLLNWPKSLHRVGKTGEDGRRLRCGTICGGTFCKYHRFTIWAGGRKVDIGHGKGKEAGSWEMIRNSVADLGSGIRCFFGPWIRIRVKFFSCG